MLKKLFKALTTLTLLTGCYFGYVHGFAIVVGHLRASKRTDSFVFRIHDSKSKRESIRYVQEACRPNHWAAADDLHYRYYNAERGYWIYAKECDRIEVENGVRYDGKRMRMKPFLLITKSRDGKNTKTITSDVAVFDLNEPLGFDVSSSREPLKIKHAHLEPNVWVRDDKGTPRDPNDDMKIGPLTTVDYEESSQQITTLPETYVVIQDPEMKATAYGMVMQLRKNEPLVPGGTSSGFEGAERVDLLKNVHVVIRDVGKSGIMPGSVQAKKAAPAKGQDKTDIFRGPDVKTAEPVEPTPLDLTCDAKMQVHLPKPQRPVLVGPPEPPAPTLVQFERNVVVLRGQPDAQPDQLTCDTLKLSLVPKEGSPKGGTPEPAPGAGQGPAQSANDLAQASKNGNGDAQPKPDADTAPKAGDGENSGGLGGLTLQRAHATGHAVWLYLPANGIKLGCNELIHVRQLPYKPDLTYFRGDRTRPLQLEKIDTVKEEGADHGKITSVTNVWAIDATLFDSGVGLDTANVVAYGPGRLETRADRDKPVERIAIWQDRLIVQNQLDSKNEVLHKIIDMTGSRPCFIDTVQKTSLDSASWIQVWLKPKPAVPPVADAASSSRVLTADAGLGRKGAGPINKASSNQNTPTPRASDGDRSAGTEHGSNTGLGGGNLQMEHLHARVDVHLLAPAKTMTAREQLDAEFVEAEVVSTPPTKPATAPSTTVVVTGPEQATEQEPDQVVAQNPAEKPTSDPPMVGFCDRMWARVALKPKSELDKAPNQQAAGTKTAAASGQSETNAEIRKVWMWGNVALHQDPAKDKEKDPGQDASGEAIYLDNRGPNKAISYIYQRDPTEKTYLPDPVPPARVENKDNQITAAGVIQMNQGTDQAWVYGPGTLTQLATRGILADKSGSKRSNDEPGTDAPADDTALQSGAPDSKIRVRTTSLVTPNDGQDKSSSLPQAIPIESKPATRAGRPLSEKVPMTIGFSENMEFTGRSVDPEGHPAAQAEFYGIVTAQMEDALLHCTKKMIAYTDREVPLTQLGKMSKGQSQPKTNGEATTENGEAEPQAELALIYCYRNAVAISRKVDPDAPILVQKQRIEADDVLAYDRRTGDFYVPNKGRVFLYDQSEDSSRTPEINTDGSGTDNGVSTGNSTLTTTQRTVSTTSGRRSNRQNEADRAGTTGTRGTPRKAPRKGDQKASDDLPLVLTQVHFNKGMRGQFGASKENGDASRRWSEFFGNVQTARAKVPYEWTTLNFDRLPADGLFLTGQTLRVIEEPPPVGSPTTAPSQYYMKAWEKAYAWSNENSLQSDVITYDSHKDLVYAYGEDGHGVNFAQQHAAGQPVSSSSSKAMQLNPKTGGLHIIDSDTISMIDKNTGIRPSAAGPVDPYAKKPKKSKKPFKLPTMNIERRGFTGQ